MLRKRVGEFAEAVWRVAASVGLNAPKVVDALLVETFPVTASAAEEEGASGIFRKGLTSEVNRVLKAAGGDDRQIDLDAEHSDFRPLVQALSRSTYKVDESEERIPVSRLISEPNLLDQARKYMRRKGEECLAEAQKLDELYAAVIAAGRP
jgi:hypothetical protein